MKRTAFLTLLCTVLVSVGPAQDPVTPPQERIPETDAATPALADTVSADGQEASDADQQVKVFSLRHCEAGSTAAAIGQLLADQSLRVVADQRTNSVIVTGRNDVLRTIEALLLKLDTGRPAPDAQLISAGVRLETDPAELRQQVVQLRRDYEAAEAEAHQFATRFRQSPDDATKQALRSNVQRAFMLRQNVLRTELLEMQMRLARTQEMIEMRERLAEQIVDRRVADLLNPQLRWDAADAAPGSAAEHVPPVSDLPEQQNVELGQDSASSKATKDVTPSELEGEWHQVTSSVGLSGQGEIRPNNRTFRGDRYTLVSPGYTYECRIQVNPDVRTIWYFSKEEDNSFTMDHYELKGDQLILRNSPEDQKVQVFERGHVRIPSVVPPATKEQENRWRSAIVEILVSGKPDVAENGARKIGFGILVDADGTMLSHLSGGWSSVIRDWPNVDARFDDGSVVPLQIIGKESAGVVILRPRESVSLNHHFPLSVAPTEIGDEVYIGQMTVMSLDSGLYGLSATEGTLSQTDRRVASLGDPVWQLKTGGRIPNSHCLPVLSEAGELVAITMSDTGGLLLAIPLAQLKDMFPQSISQSLSVPVPAK